MKKWCDAITPAPEKVKHLEELLLALPHDAWQKDQRKYIRGEADKNKPARILSFGLQRSKVPNSKCYPSESKIQRITIVVFMMLLIVIALRPLFGTNGPSNLFIRLRRVCCQVYLPSNTLTFSGRS